MISTYGKDFVNLCIADLPCVKFSDRKNLPKECGIYFLLFKNKIPAYIGESENIYLRVYKGSHRAVWSARDLPETHSVLEIAYLNTEALPALVCKDYRKAIEKTLIVLYYPIFNVEILTIKKFSDESRIKWIEMMCA